MNNFWFFCFKTKEQTARAAINLAFSKKQKPTDFPTFKD